MLRKIVASTKVGRRTLINNKEKDYMPWPNEHSTIGTTYDAMIDGENRSDRVCVSEEAIHTEPMWENSSANPEISELTEEENSDHLAYLKDKPSTVHLQPKQKDPKEGLFKAPKKQSFKRLP